MIGTSAVIMALIQAGIVPEISAFIRNRFTKTGKFPTDAEIIARVIKKKDAIIAKGEAFLAETAK
jgi:hypothetical protein